MRIAPLALALTLLAPCTARAASPSFTSFATNDFNIITNLSAPWQITANRFGVTNSFTNITQIFTNSTVINTNVTITNVTIQESTFQSIFTNVNNYVYNTNVTNFYDNSTIIYTNTTIVIDGTNMTPDDHLVFASDFDTVPGNLITKTLAGDGIVLSVAGDLDDHLVIALEPSQKLWTNNAGSLEPIDFSLPLFVKSLQTSNTLRTDGAFLTTHSAATTLAAGDNVLALSDISYLALASLDNSAVVKLTSGSGNGQHLWVFNFWTNATFTLPSGVCDDDPGVVVEIRGGAWSPVETGESLELFRTTNGWVEVNRANPNSGPPVTTDSQLWTNNAGTLRPADLTLPLLWTNAVTLGVDGSAAIKFGPSNTNVLYRSGSSLYYTNTAASFVVGDTSNILTILTNASGTATIMPGGNATAIALRDASNNEVRFFGNTFTPVAAGTTLGAGTTAATLWGNANFGAAVRIYGMLNSSTNSRLTLSHSGTNGAAIFDSQATGSAGAARGFAWQTNGVTIATLAVDGSTTYARSDSEPAAPAAGSFTLFAVDSVGKMVLKVRFPTGASQTIATEP